MKYISYYTVIIEHYDYFGGHKIENNKFNTLIEAWNFFKSHLKCVCHYDDGSFWKIEKPILRWKWEKPRHVYRWTKRLHPPIFENVFNTDEEDIFNMDEQDILI